MVSYLGFLDSMKKWVAILAACLMIIAAWFVGAVSLPVAAEQLFGVLGLGALWAGFVKLRLLEFLDEDEIRAKSWFPEMKTHASAAMMIASALMAWATDQQGTWPTIIAIIAATGLSTSRFMLGELTGLLKRRLN